MKNTQTKSQKIASCVTHAKEADLTDQTDQRSPDADVPTSVPTRQIPEKDSGQRRQGGAGRTMVRPNPPWFPARCILAGDQVLCFRGRLGMFPCKELAGTDLKHYIRGLPPLSLSLSHHLEKPLSHSHCDLYSLG